jgi:hypothetical protein
MGQPTKPEPLPKALERHTRAFYDGLELLGKDDPEIGGLVVETRLSYLFQELEIPSTYYARIRVILFGGADPCVIMLRRGTHGNPSVVVLRHPPSAELFADEGLTQARSAATVFLDATKRVEKLEAWRDSLTPADENRLNVVEALRNHETRLAALEASQEGETNGKTAQDRNTPTS